MRAVLQRVTRASVVVEGAEVGRIGPGWLVLLGVERSDADADADWMADKVANLRAFEDDAGKMKRSALDVGGEVLLISQFTLLGDCRTGRRPSFIEAAEPSEADRLYQRVHARIKAAALTVATGVFRAQMQVELVNDGPVTLLLDSRKRF